MFSGVCCCTICLLAFFFFFKQKTAYEMRISDWSSDVCSSDLHQPSDSEVTGTDGTDFFVLTEGDQLLSGGSGADYYFVGKNSGKEIGRASCRERVRQYV